MIVLSDGMQVHNLAQIRLLDLPGQLGAAGAAPILPEAVYGELVAESSYAENLQYTFDIGKPKDTAFVDSLLSQLDVGRAQAIALARERGAELLLMDHRKGRAVAASFGIPHVGLMAFLVEGKFRGRIKALKPLLDELIPRPKHATGDDLYSRVLREVGE